ncbi:MAG: hypothetical protein AVDCRST_MAG01-01-3127, partial [uncultured Rubrobacteraceae bacterium]
VRGGSHPGRRAASSAGRRNDEGHNRGDLKAGEQRQEVAAEDGAPDPFAPQRRL